MINDTRKKKPTSPEVIAARNEFLAAPEDALLDRRTVAAGLNISTSLLEKFACKGGGPPYHALGRLRRYRKGDVLDWYSRKVQRRWNTSDDGDQVEQGPMSPASLRFAQRPVRPRA